MSNMLPFKRYNIQDSIIVHSYSGLAGELSDVGQCFSSFAHYSGMLLTSASLPILHFYRYTLLARKHALSTWELAQLGGFLILVLIVECALAWADVCYDQPRRNIDYSKYWYHDLEEPQHRLFVTDVVSRRSSDPLHRPLAELDLFGCSSLLLHDGCWHCLHDLSERDDQ